MNTHDYIKGFEARDKMGSLLGHKLISLTDQECISEYQTQPEHFNPNDILHGGALYTVMDSAQGAFVHFNLEPQFKYASTGTSTIKYLAPVFKGLIKIKTQFKNTENRKIFICSEAYNEQNVLVATLDEIWIAALKST